MIDIFLRGGPLMYPILLCSIIGWAIFMERLFAYVRVRRSTFQVRQQVLQDLNTDREAAACEFCLARRNVPLARILARVLQYGGGNRGDRKALAEEVGEREALALQRYLGLLATIANITPLLGLLGTVLGMIEAFNVIAQEGVGTPATLGGGISEALITTAAGLTVAVPMLLLHRYLAGRAERLVTDLEEATMQVVDQTSH